MKLNTVLRGGVHHIDSRNDYCNRFTNLDPFLHKND